MSTSHGEIAIQKPISEMAEYLRLLIPADIPKTYSLKPEIENIASEKNIRNGIIAFRDFIYLFCDRLSSDGHLYSKPQKTNNPTDYQFLNNINYLLIDMGYNGKLSENGKSLLITDISLFSDPKPKISIPKQLECIRFLTLCGFVFTGIDLTAKKSKLSEMSLIEVSYPNNPIMLTGLKALSIADMELRTGRRYWNDFNILRCDYHLIKADKTDELDVLKDILHSLPKEVQKFALSLHQRYIDMGMTCVIINDDAVHFAYSYIKNSKRDLSPRDIYQSRVWEFALSIKYGYCIAVRAKKTYKYEDIIEKFSLYLQNKIAQGYGCDRKLRNERCQHGCQGIRIPLDNRVLDIKQDIEIWLDNEVPCS